MSRTERASSAGWEAVDECLRCGDSPEHTLEAEPGEFLGICRDCWTARHENGLEDDLADKFVLTPRLVTELQAEFYELTESRDQRPLTSYLTSFLEEGALSTTVRLGSAPKLAYHVGIAGRERAFYDGVKWPGVDDANDSLYAATVYPPLDADVPLRSGVFVAGKTVEELNEALLETSHELACILDGGLEADTSP